MDDVRRREMRLVEQSLETHLDLGNKLTLKPSKKLTKQHIGSIVPTPTKQGLDPCTAHLASEEPCTFLSFYSVSRQICGTSLNEAIDICDKA
ncbi:hypothetical protein Y1Q_0016334 [Alligator mississippiensis]|uniref:Uncharacterized protein n=1 Tax=Alligator mississippiensis TaxID=8496 RepID=A0A151N2B9_ALLMI|nr:hypothetical protein Y1Q_0016334 [Alligator mississippiensis]